MVDLFFFFFGGVFWCLDLQQAAGQYYYCWMSCLIDQNDKFFRPFRLHHTSSAPKLTPTSSSRNPNYQSLFQKVPRQIRECVQFFQSAEMVRITLMSDVVISQQHILQILTLDRCTHHWQNQIQIIDKYHQYVKLYNNDKILYIFKEFLKRQSNCNLPFKLAISPNSGAIKIMVYQSLHLPQLSHRDFLAKLRNVIDSTSFMVVRHQRSIMDILELSNRQLPAHHPNLPERMKKYSKKFGVFLSLINEEDAESQVAAINQRQKYSRRQLLDRQLLLTGEDYKQLSLYTECNPAWSTALGQSDLEFQLFEKQEIKNRIKMPGLTKCRNIYENNYILNCIRIKNSNQLNLQLINHGGFTSIYLAEVQFWYVYSGYNNQVVAPVNNEGFTAEKMIRKMMVIKREERLPAVEGRKMKNRIEHEKNILKQIKSGNALFIPKYYISTEENTLKNDLLSDYVFLPNLIEYVLSQKLSLSLSSKIYILFMLTQGVRYLKQYRIVHLDLKPNNIMISRTMMVKIIDFGESYHPEICPTQHAPGFTMPYSSPESYYPSGTFSQKNDIFSIGVIAYEILYGKFPFFLYNEKTHHEIYKYKEYTNHWFYTPEELRNYGDSEVFPLLQLVFGRCLDPDPARRPQLDWICLMLRECIDFYL